MSLATTGIISRMIRKSYPPPPTRYSGSARAAQLKAATGRIPPPATRFAAGVVAQLAAAAVSTAAGTIATEVGVGFNDLTEFTVVKQQIEKMHGCPEKSLEALSTITMLAWNLKPGGDTVNTWIKALNVEEIRAAKWATSADVIEIYPSGTHGQGKHDRLWLQVGKTQVKVVKVYLSDH